MALGGLGAKARSAGRLALALFAVAVLAAAANAASWARWEREPLVHDEFSYLLAADTFAHGRLTNPTHLMWRHFETYHVLQRPTYQSKYPPGQGLALALGIVVLGHPIAGVWASYALACAAVAWMLRGWMRPRWALAGGLLAALHPVMGAFWGQTYWGGAVAMCGGALVYGAVPRLVRRARAGPSAALGLGLALLLLSRPVEGALASAPALAFLLWRRWRRGGGRGVRPWRLWAPAALVLSVAAVWLGYYHWRVTGSPLRPPYWAWVEAYQNPSVAVTADLRNYRGSPDLTLAQRVYRVGGFYAPLSLGLLLPGLWWMRRSAWTRLHAAAALGLVAASVAFTRGWPHYTAPVAGAVLALFVQGFRGLRRAARARPLPRAAVALLPLLALGAWSARVSPGLWANPHVLEREALLNRLEGTARDHLVIVRYGPDHASQYEWVWNEADIDAARVVWARELGGGQTRALRAYFASRRVWLFEPDAVPPRFGDYPMAVVK